MNSSTLLAVALLAMPLAAQAVSLEFTPNPAPPGVAVTITGTDATAADIVLPSPCGWLSIHQGSQKGPVVGPNLSCPAVLVNVPRGGAFSVQWDQRNPDGTLVLPGNYWVETRVWDSGLTAIQVDWFCLTILAPGAPALTTAGPAQRGQFTALQIAAPSAPGAAWFCALSLDSNIPLTILGLPTCLSEPITGAMFDNAFGVLDAGGNSMGLALNVPNLAFVQYWGLQVQALLLDGAGLQSTNGRSFTVR